MSKLIHFLRIRFATYTCSKCGFTTTSMRAMSDHYQNGC